MISNRKYFINAVDNIINGIISIQADIYEIYVRCSRKDAHNMQRVLMNVKMINLSIVQSIYFDKYTACLIQRRMQMFFQIFNNIENIE